MLAFAYGAAGIADLWWGAGLLHGLKLVAVAVIAQAVLGMAKSFCADAPRASIAAAALALVSFVPGSLAQLAAIVGGGLAGMAAVRGARDGGGRRFRARVCRAARRSSRWRSFSRCWRCRSRPPARGSRRSPPPSIAPARWCSAAAMSCCRCCATPWLRRDCCRRAHSSPAMARRRRCRDRCSPWRPASARSPERRRRESRAGSWRWRRSSCRGCWRLSPRCRSGARCAARRMRKPRWRESMRRWSACSPRRSTIRPSSAPCRARAISPSRRRRSRFSSPGARRRSSSPRLAAAAGVALAA